MAYRRGDNIYSVYRIYVGEKGYRPNLYDDAPRTGVSADCNDGCRIVVKGGCNRGGGVVDKKGDFQIPKPKIKP